MCRICIEGYYIDAVGKCHETIIKSNNILV